MAINFSGVSYSVNNFNILNDISLTVNDNDFMCILGPNGAGKSTLIKLMCGLIKNQSGSISLFNRDISTYKRKELARYISYVPQHSYIQSQFSVEEYIMTGRYPYQTFLNNTSVYDKEIVDKVIYLTGLEKFRKRDIRDLSGGERQKVMIGASLAQESKVILLDEPSIFLDPRSAVEIHLLLRKIHLSGVTIVMVTHDINLALIFGSVFVGIKYGGIFFKSNNINELADKKYFDKLFDISFYPVVHPQHDILQLLSGYKNISGCIYE